MTLLGDPNASGVLLTAGYLVAAVLCGIAARGSVWSDAPFRGGRRTPVGTRVSEWRPVRAVIFYARPLRSIWLLAATFFLLMGINKQADLQSYLWEALRSLKHSLWWARDRQEMKVLFAAAAIAICLLAIYFLQRTYRPRDRWEWLVTTAVAVQLAFVGFRVATLTKLPLTDLLAPHSAIVASTEAVGILIGIGAAVGQLRSIK